MPIGTVAHAADNGIFIGMLCQFGQKFTYAYTFDIGGNITVVTII